MQLVNVLMIGWEYPPHIAGGLGTACEGLTRALARSGANISFILPFLHGDEQAEHMKLFGQHSFAPGKRLVSSTVAGDPEEMNIVRTAMETYLMPYWTETTYSQFVESQQIAGALATVEELVDDETAAAPAAPLTRQDIYGSDIFEQVAKFTQRVISEARGYDFDVIHAHDWMTYPAAKALHDITGKPLVAHVHSLEYDRSGHGANSRIRDIERLGIESANTIIAVSHYTKGVIEREYGAPGDKIRVVHNGIYGRETISHYREENDAADRPVVLFLGRVTYQKGPDYFVKAAQKVVPHVPDVLFVLAGSGDMLEPVKRMVTEAGLEAHFHFPGFVRGKDVEEYYTIADLYVMPSVSEPFGITALEAVELGTPTLISRQSGASEVLGNALKFDFWDVERLADLIINCLLHPEMRNEMVQMAKRELGSLRWDAAASKTMDVYNSLLTKGISA